MKKKNNSELLKAFQKNYDNRFAELNNKFDKLMENTLDRKYAFSDFEENHFSLNVYLNQRCENLNNEFIHKIKLDKKNSFKSLLNNYIEEHKPEIKFIGEFGIYIAEYNFNEILEKYKVENFPELLIKDENEIKSNPEHSTRRQVIAFYYVLKDLKVFENTDKTVIARYIQFLTGKDLNVKGIKNTNIYKFLLDPFKTNEKDLKKDLNFVKDHYEKLGLTDLVSSIEKDINKLK